ncbi:hypothetical protein [Corynebacterium pygosceleis]|uniref:Uncharacterized protein n=1 Tax=Corynebacterium pygosceleis TaxID=2800406 RepID=A0A9Q4C7Z2_9CORY|nr:hypothetical protein [Corynebacterium pygosceleis]MCK7637685.1 hypothetical protein [Corynebacterium pygosceleis]MCK7674876.1 hypothetical protein [Corynebacterium pygosceleis]MCL0119535.1 hypothetical protein [Corynebacterium pygosceleis]MCX7444775.1 hypothetical protein [Corynebacterium pygosceleis]MCX7467986.1 hypothetical protein [Corynebacterium pygosceleis]
MTGGPTTGRSSGAAPSGPGRDPAEARRRKLQRDTVTGFVSFFAVVALIQAVVNVTRPEPAVWPAVLALVLVLAAVWLWRSGRRR